MSAPTEIKISGIDRAKFFIKQSLWSLPGPLSRMAIRAGCASGLIGKWFQTYEKLGRPSEVLSGPFRGMAYLPFARGSALLPKILGTYESELHPLLARLKQEPCDLLVDVGSAEGYYAVGLSRIFEIPRAYCFEIDTFANRLLARLARLNGVADRMIARGFCRPADLQAVLDGAVHPLVVSDCEGGEVDLLDPVAAPGLRKARIIVEVHDYDGRREIADELRRRFAATHEIEAIEIQPRRLSELPAACQGLLTDDEALKAMNEARGHQAAGWLFLRPMIDPPA